ncbi:MAG TPA: PH domain-containing protein [Sphingomicrobium sp.]|nr:PH domain-containing protein [Sphingomicrobium sp.]
MNDDASLGPVERLHPLFLITGLGSSMRRAGGAFAALGYLAVSGKWAALLFVAPMLAVILVAGLFIYWRHFEFRVGASEIRIDHGVLTRTHRSIPFDRIQDVDITQPLLARAFGLARVKFETGGSAGAKEEEGILQAITLERAQALRALVRARRGVVDEVPATAAAEPQPIYAMDLRHVLLAGLFNFSLALLAGLFGFTQTVGQFAGFDPFSRRFWLGMLAAGSPLLDLILVHQIIAALAGLIVLVLVGIATGIVRSALRDYGFRLDRSGTGLRRRRGLLTLTDVTLPIRRIQAAIIGTGPLREAFGWHDLKLQSLARDETTKGDHIVAPLADLSEVATVLAELGWRQVGPDIHWRRVSPAYAWSFTFAMAALAFPATIQFLFVPPIGIAAFAIIFILIAMRWLAWRRTRYALDGDRLLVRRGWWRRRLVILPLTSVQSVDLTENFISRWFGTASLLIGVAGGSGFSAHGVPALPHDSAHALRAELLSQF